MRVIRAQQDGMHARSGCAVEFIVRAVAHKEALVRVHVKTRGGQLVDSPGGLPQPFGTGKDRGVHERRERRIRPQLRYLRRAVGDESGAPSPRPQLPQRRLGVRPRHEHVRERGAPDVHRTANARVVSDHAGLLADAPQARLDVADGAAGVVGVPGREELREACAERGGDLGEHLVPDRAGEGHKSPPEVKDHSRSSGVTARARQVGHLDRLSDKSRPCNHTDWRVA